MPEVRTLVRSCYENLFLTASLLEKGEAFVEEMRRDEQAARAGLARVLYQGHRAEVGDDDPLVKQLKAQIEWLTIRYPKPVFLKPGDAAKGTAIAHTYLVYRKISGDSAHPSITALRRHLNIALEDGVRVMGLDVRPPSDEAERIQTLDWACCALMTVCIAVEDILGVQRSPGLIDAADRYEAVKSPSPAGLLPA